MFAGAYTVGLARQIKYSVRTALNGAVLDQLMVEVGHSKCLQAMLRQQPRALYPIINDLLDRRWSSAKRFQVTRISLRFMETVLGTTACLRLIEGQALVLTSLPDGTQVTLEMNGVSYHEGLWALNLVGQDGERLYSLTFGLTNFREILIGSVQGPSCHLDGAERIRALTHAAEGLRPGYLLVYLLRALAQHLGVRRLKAIDPLHHVKGRWNHRGSRLKFDYREFWADLGGSVNEDANWTLPLSVPQRPLTEVPSKRRAMYRRRYSMLDAMVKGMLERVSQQIEDQSACDANLASPPSLAPKRDSVALRAA
ncbi:MAG: DUF535 family protein [Burkholderiaceae bacterium]|nr:DUF535 family protein [Burkholderiaceae bacterium]